MVWIMRKKAVLRGMLYLAFFCLCFGGGHWTAQRRAMETIAMQKEEKKGFLTIVIDDFGYCGEGTNEILTLPMPFTAAIMPFLECSASDYQKAVAAGKETMIHMPMESKAGHRAWVGEKGIFCTMSDEEIQARVREALEIFPTAVALNNHMGSAIMEDKRCLGAVLDVVKERDMVFLDSMTTPNSVAVEVSQAREVQLLRRNVFLDSTNDIEVVKQRLRQAGEVALQEGFAIAIGHVGPEGGNITAQAIRDVAPELVEKGVTFLTVAEMRQKMEIPITKDEEPISKDKEPISKEEISEWEVPFSMQE